MTAIIRITQHPHAADIAVIHSPPDWATSMGRFAPARYDADRRAYLLDNEHVDAFMKFANIEHARVVDERRAPARVPLGPNPLPECANCGQPGSRTSPPKTCPDCGQAWTAVTFRAVTPGAQRTNCTACGYRQSGKFPYCSQCGAAMVYPEAKEIPAFITQHTRERLDDPMSLGQVLADVLPAKTEETT